MHPVISRLGPVNIYSYGLMLVAAFVICVYFAEQEARRQGFVSDLVWNTAIIAIAFGIAGARIFYVLENIKFYFENPLEIIILQHGGLSWFGGFILGTTATVFYLKKKKVSVVRTLDLFAPYLALAQSIGRIGCFLNGCCYGKASIWGIYFPVHGQALIPTQLYSCLALLLIFVLLKILQSKHFPQGCIISSYLFLYSIKRFVVEFFRNDNPVIISGLTLFQVISIAMFLCSLISLLFIFIKYRAKNI